MPNQFTLALPGGQRAFTLALALPAAAILAVSDLLTYLAGPSTKTIVARAATYFSADGEANLWSWYSGLVLTLIGIAFALLAASATVNSRRRAYWILAVVGFYLSADEIASLHELLFQPAAAIGLGQAGWLALGIPLVLVAGTVLLLLARALGRVFRRRLILAGAVFLTGAVGFEAVNEFLLDSLNLHPWSPLYLLETTIEESLEFAGSLIALSAAVRELANAATRNSILRIDGAFPEAVVG